MAERELQEEEMDAMSAIYDAQFQRLENVWHNPRFAIEVTPGESQAAPSHTRATLVVTYAEKYPYVAPTVALEAARGLSRDEQERLLAELQREAQGLAGQDGVYVFELVQLVKRFLQEHNRCHENARDEMTARQQRDQDVKAGEKTLARRMQQDLARESLAEEMERQERIEDSRLEQRRESTLPTGQSLEENALSSLGLASPARADEVEEDDHVEELLSNLADRTKSRWETDFRELSFLGSGGFGEVVKARNRLDKYVYAVKKVLASSQECQKILEEVVSLKRLEHPYIVRYYSAWIEKGFPATGRRRRDRAASGDPPGDGDASDSESDSEDYGGDGHAEDDISGDGDLFGQDDELGEEGGYANWMLTPTSVSGYGRPADESSSSGSSSSAGDSRDGKVGDAERAETSASSNGFIIFEAPSNTGEAPSPHPWQSSDAAGASFDVFQSRPFGGSPQLRSPEARKRRPRRTRKREWCLYIQMEYCDLTLKDVIDTKEHRRRPREIWRLFRQVLEGLEHMHSRKCIHRDLKPTNIFLTQNGMGVLDVRIGDFGLVKEAGAGKRKTLEDDAHGGVTEDDSGVGIPPRRDETRPGDGPAFPLPPEQARVGLSESEALGDMLTGGVGTAIYRAPEQEEGGHYDEAADMFSCGIIFFEMLAEPFSTGMERVIALSDLRLSKLPDAFVRRLQAPQSDANSVESCSRALDIVPALVSLSPAVRPTAKGLLKPGVLPLAEEVAKDYEKDLGIITNPKNTSYGKLLEALFGNLLRNPNPIPGLEVAFGRPRSAAGANAGLDILEEAMLRSVVVRCLGDVFEGHGAVAVQPPLLRLAGADEGKAHHALPQARATSVGTDDADRGIRADGMGQEHVVHLVDRSGALTQLPDNLTTPFARMAARMNLSNLKRYEIGRVFYRGLRPSGSPGVHVEAPWEAYEADFDVLQDAEPISSPADAPPMSDAVVRTADVCEAETSLVALRAMEVLKTAMGRTVLRVNNVKMAGALFDLLGIPKGVRRRARQAVGDAALWEASGAGLEMLPGSSEASVALEGLWQLCRSLHRDQSFDGVLRFVSALGAYVQEIPRVAEALKAGMTSDAGATGRKDLRRVLQLWRTFTAGAQALARTVRSLKAIHEFLGSHGPGAGPDAGSGRFAASKTAGKARKAKGRGKGRRRRARERRGSEASSEADDEPRLLGKSVLLCLDLSMSSRVYRSGFVFQVCVDGARASGTGGGGSASWDIVAEGGRYDALVTHFRPPGYVRLQSLREKALPNPHPTVAAGVHFSVDKLCALVAQHLCRLQPSHVSAHNALAPMPPWLPATSPHVVVASVEGLGSRGLQDRLRIASLLWSKGLRANYLPQTGSDEGYSDSAVLSLLGMDRALRDEGLDAPPEGMEQFRLPRMGADADLRSLARACAGQGVPVLVVLTAPLSEHDDAACAVCMITAEAAASERTGQTQGTVPEPLSLTAALAAVADASPGLGPHPSPVPSVSQRVAVRHLGNYVCAALSLLRSQRLPAGVAPDARSGQTSDGLFKALASRHGVDDNPTAPLLTSVSSSGDPDEGSREGIGGSRTHAARIEVVNADPNFRDNKNPYGPARSMRGVRVRAEELLLSMVSGGPRSDWTSPATPVIIAPLSYFTLRDVGTAVARSGTRGKEVKSLSIKRNLVDAVHMLLRRMDEVLGARKPPSASNGADARTTGPFVMMLYSTVDDRFDVVYV